MMLKYWVAKPSDCCCKKLNIRWLARRSRSGRTRALRNLPRAFHSPALLTDGLAVLSQLIIIITSSAYRYISAFLI